MYSLPGAYLGLSPIENGKTNVAMLAQTEKIQSAGGIDSFLTWLLEQKEAKKLRDRLLNGKMHFKKWLSCGVPKFGKRKIPIWPNAYFIGDTSGAITPVCGDGLAMALGKKRVQ